MRKSRLSTTPPRISTPSVPPSSTPTPARRDAAVAALKEELAALEARRKELAGSFEEGLFGIYERIRTRSGIGAARLFHGTSEASGIALAAGDLAEIKAAPADDIVFCPDSGAILVRSAEWGA